MTAADSRASVAVEELKRSLARAWLDSTGRATSREMLAGRVEHFDEIGSTNDRVRELAALQEHEGAIVIADTQTQGRGRLGRAWHSPGGLGVYLSILLRPAGSAASSPLFGLLAAVAAAEALAPFAATPVTIKWPNDLMIESVGPVPGVRLKVAGILAEARTVGDRVADVVIGMGVNVNQAAGDFPPEIAMRATSLSLASGMPVKRPLVATSLVEQLARWYTLWQTEGPQPILAAYRKLAPDLVGRRVVIRDGGRSVEGTTAGMADDGALRMDIDGQESGQSRWIRYGDLWRVEEEA